MPASANQPDIPGALHAVPGACRHRARDEEDRPDRAGERGTSSGEESAVGGLPSSV